MRSKCLFKDLVYEEPFGYRVVHHRLSSKYLSLCFFLFIYLYGLLFFVAFFLYYKIFQLLYVKKASLSDTSDNPMYLKKSFI